MSRQDVVQVAVLLTGCLLVILNYTLLAPALPVIMREMNVEETTVQWLTSIYSLVEAVVIPLNAFFLGRMSVRRLFIGALALFVAGSLAAAAAPSFELLLAGRVLQAAAAGVAMPMVWTLVLLMAPRESRGQVMGLMGIVIAFAPAIGPPVSGMLIDSFGWRFVFVIVAVLGLIAIAVCLALLRNREGFERTSFDSASVVLSSLGMLGFLYGLSTITSSSTPWASALVMAAGALCLLLFVRRQKTLEIPLLRVETLAVRPFRNAVVVCCLLEAALIAIDVLLPLFLQNSIGASPTTTGLAMAPAALAGAVSGLIAGRVFDRRGVRGIVLAGAALLVTAAVALCLCTDATTIAIVAVIYCVETIGWQLVSTPSNTWGINALPDEVIQHGNAVLSTLMQVGASFGTAALVSLTAFGPLLFPGADASAVMLAGYHAAFVGTAVLLGIVALVIVVGIRDGR